MNEVSMFDIVAVDASLRLTDVDASMMLPENLNDVFKKNDEMMD